MIQLLVLEVPRWFPALSLYVGALGSVVSLGVALVSPGSDPIASCLVPPSVGGIVVPLTSDLGWVSPSLYFFWPFLPSPLSGL